jgi:hypothetical protein
VVVEVEHGSAQAAEQVDCVQQLLLLVAVDHLNLHYHSHLELLTQ